MLNVLTLYWSLTYCKKSGFWNFMGYIVLSLIHYLILLLALLTRARPCHSVISEIGHWSTLSNFWLYSYPYVIFFTYQDSRFTNCNNPKDIASPHFKHQWITYTILFTSCYIVCCGYWGPFRDDLMFQIEI